MQLLLEKRRRCLILITPNEIRGYNNPPINNAEGVEQQDLGFLGFIIQHLRRCHVARLSICPALHTGLSRLNPFGVKDIYFNLIKNLI